MSIDGENIAIIVTTETYVYNVAFDYNNDGVLDTTKGDRKANFWMTGVIKYRTLQSDGTQHLPRNNTVNLNEILYNPGSNYMSYVSGASKYTPQTLPVGTYKVWLFRNDNHTIGSYELGMDPLKKMAPLMLCEPITFKVIDKDNPDFSISSSMYAPYFGKQTAGHDTFNSILTIEKAIFKKGEPIYFDVAEDYCARQIYITHGHADNCEDDGNLEEDRVYRFDRPYVWQYAEYGVKSLDASGRTYGNYLDTSRLDPGQYKIYYFMGENVQKAYRGDDFSLGGNHYSKCKIYTIIDIIILPEGVEQSVTVNYTKYDGTSASVTSSNLPFGGTALETVNGHMHIWHKYHMGVYYTDTIDNVKPGTEITVTVNTNISSEYSAWDEIMATPIVLHESKTKVQNK